MTEKLFAKKIALLLFSSVLMLPCAMEGSALAYGTSEPAPAESSSAPAGHEGKVVTSLDAPSYTYIELEHKGERKWIAVPTMKVKAGDYVKASTGIEMHDFYGKALQRTFPVIFFVTFAEVVEKEGSKKETPMAAAPHQKDAYDLMKPKLADSPEKGSIKQAKGGHTIKDIFNKKKKLKGKEVTVHGKVVKASGNIMGRRWYHIQDGTAGKDGKNDLVFTSSDDAEAGDTVMAKGTLVLDKDFGMGYKYDVIVEDAKITIDK